MKKFDYNEMGDMNMLMILKSLGVGVESPLISVGTQRKTLNIIDRARTKLKIEDRQSRFIFGKTVKNGQNKFVGITVKRVA
jgi:hypothetical protein